MTAQEWAVSIFTQAQKNFRLIDVPEKAINHFAKIASKNDVGELMMRRFEIFKPGDLELLENFWQQVTELLDTISED